MQYGKLIAFVVVALGVLSAKKLDDDEDIDEIEHDEHAYDWSEEPFSGLKEGEEIREKRRYNGHVHSPRASRSGERSRSSERSRRSERYRTSYSSRERGESERSARKLSRAPSVVRKNGFSEHRPAANGPAINSPSVNRPAMNGPASNTPSINRPAIATTSANKPDINSPVMSSPVMNAPAPGNPGYPGGQQQGQAAPGTGSNFPGIIPIPLGGFGGNSMPNGQKRNQSNHSRNYAQSVSGDVYLLLILLTLALLVAYLGY